MIIIITIIMSMVNIYYNIIDIIITNNFTFIFILLLFI